MRLGVGPLEACTADHDIDLVLARVGPEAVPEQLHGAFGAVRLQHARAAKLHEAVARRLGSNQRRDIVLACRVETETALSNLLAQQAIGADDVRPAGPRPGVRSRAGLGAAILDKQVVADGVVGILVEAAHAGDHARRCTHLLVENFVAQPLSAEDVLAALSEAHLEIADAAVHLRRLLAHERQAFGARFLVERLQCQEATRRGVEEGIFLPSPSDAPGQAAHSGLPCDAHGGPFRDGDRRAAGGCAGMLP